MQTAVNCKKLAPQQSGFATLESVEGGANLEHASFTCHVVKIQKISTTTIGLCHT